MSFNLIMRDIDGGCLHALMQKLHLGAHLVAQFGVEIGQWFIKKKYLGLPDNRPPHGDALFLTTGQFPGTAFQQVTKPQYLGCLMGS